MPHIFPGFKPSGNAMHIPQPRLAATGKCEYQCMVTYTQGGRTFQPCSLVKPARGSDFSLPRGSVIVGSMESVDVIYIQVSVFVLFLLYTGLNGNHLGNIFSWARIIQTRPR